ncbi:NAD-dependent epimerase/dehydratase family protein [Pedobacter immunditicola]|uniref:NAD-dependent epimerase/dehydratase family protein n=1 Tax=Pedobacter immunditicola TaxID=3133440 RepID=UPI0030AF54A1
MKKKVLITGASGFVGFHLLNEALADNLEVYAAVRSNSSIKHLQNLPVNFVNLDFTSVDSLKHQLAEKEYDYIIHAAGITKAKSEAEYNVVNAEYTRNLALAANSLNKPIEKFVFVSSLAALGPLKDLNGKINDDTIANPVTSYGKSKLLAEKYLNEINGLPLVVIRPTAVYGPREKDILILFKTINKGIEPYIGNFRQQLSFIYVKDLARVIVNALCAVVKNKSYNVSDGEVYNRYALADFTKELLQKKTIKFHLPVTTVSGLATIMDLLYSRSQETPALNKEKMAELTAVNWACSIENIKKDLDYQPSFNLEQGLKETLSWYKSNHWL